MGYTTTFHGSIKIEPPLDEAERGYLQKFVRSRRTARGAGPYDLGEGRKPVRSAALRDPTEKQFPRR